MTEPALSLQSGGADLRDPLHDLRRTHRAADAAQFTAGTERHHRRDAADAQRARGARVLVAVELGQQRLALELLRCLLELRRHHPARPAPLGPDIDHHRQLGLAGHGCKARIGQLDRLAGQQLFSAVAAGWVIAQAILGHAVGRQAMGAGDQHGGIRAGLIRYPRMYT